MGGVALRTFSKTLIHHRFTISVGKSLAVLGFLACATTAAHAAVDEETLFVFNTFSFLIWGALVMWMCACRGRSNNWVRMLGNWELTLIPNLCLCQKKMMRNKRWQESPAYLPGGVLQTSFLLLLRDAQMSIGPRGASADLFVRAGGLLSSDTGGQFPVSGPRVRRIANRQIQDD